jgi:hypothetical protein
MLQRFKGEEGRRRLVEVFATQELVLQNRVLAQQLAGVATLKAYKKGQEVYIEKQPGKNKLYFILREQSISLSKNVSSEKYNVDKQWENSQSSIRA